MAQASLKKLKRFWKIASRVEQVGANALTKAFKLKPVIWPQLSLKEFLQDQLGKKVYALFDQKYYFVPWGDWQNLIEVDWVDTKTYLKDRRDCDNFSFAFASRMSILYGLNTAGVVRAERYDRETGEKVGHLFNAIVTREGGQFKLYWYEPQTDQWSLHQKGRKPKIGKWEYTPTWFFYF